MKTTIFSILILATLLVWFCFFGENIPYKSQKEGWAFSDGESGTPIPKDGAEGYMNVFVISEGNEATPNQTAEAQQDTTVKGQTNFPISVSVEKQTTEKQHQTQKWEAQEWGIFITGAGVGALAVEIVMVSGIGAYWLKCRKRRKQNEKRKNRTHTAHCLP